MERGRRGREKEHRGKARQLFTDRSDDECYRGGIPGGVEEIAVTLAQARKRLNHKLEKKKLFEERNLTLPQDDQHEIKFWEEIINDFSKGPELSEREHLVFNLFKELTGYRVQDSGYVGRVPLETLACMLTETGHTETDDRLRLIELFITVDDVYVSDRNEKTRKEMEKARSDAGKGNKSETSKTLRTR